MVAVPDEVHIADLVQIDRGQRLPLHHHPLDAAPALLHHVGARQEPAIEVVVAPFTADNVGEWDALAAKRALATDIQTCAHVRKRKHIGWLPANQVEQCCQQRFTACIAEQTVEAVLDPDHTCSLPIGNGSRAFLRTALFLLYGKVFTRARCSSSIHDDE